MKKRMLSMLLAIVMVVGLMPGFAVTASAAESYSYPTSTPTPTWTGNGTETDPYVIDTAQELADMAYLVNTNSTYGTKFYKLGADIDLENEEWTPIGISGKPFKGTFDGAGLSVKNLKIENPTGSSVGLFGLTIDANFKNLTVSGNVSGSKNSMGGIVGQIQDGGTISDCVNYVNVTNNGTSVVGSGGTGGIVGCIRATTTGGPSGKITGCKNYGTITGGNVTGGIVGGVYGTVENCINAGTVSGNGITGGVCGTVQLVAGTDSFTNCSNTAAVSGKSGVGSFGTGGNGTSGVGGVCGAICSSSSSNPAVMSKCFNAGKVTNTGTCNNYSGAGGVIGGGVWIKLDNCYNAGEVVSDGSVGGIAGIQRAYTQLVNCHNYGAITTTATTRAGGISGYRGNSSNDIITNCYYVNTNLYGSANSSTHEIAGQLERKTEAEFADGTVYKLLQAANGTTQVWGQTIGTDNYPVFYNGSNVPVIKVTVEISVTADEAAPYTYDGTAKTGYTGTPTGGAYTGELEYVYKNGSTVLPGAPKDAGTYTLVVRVPDTDATYKGESAPITFSINPAEFGIAWSNTALTYNGSEQAPTVTATGLVSGDSCEITVTGAMTNVGSYTATASAVSNPNYKLPDANTTTFTIAAKPLSEVILTLAPDTLVFDGTEQGVTSITAAFGDVILTLGTDYTVDEASVTKATDVSTGNGYAVTINAVDGSNYSGSQTAYWTIVKGNFTSAVTMTGYTYGGDAVPTPTVTQNPGNGTVTFYYNTTDRNSGGTEWKNMTATSLDAGTYYMYAKIGVSDSYHAYSTVPVAFTISKGMQTASDPTGSYAISSEDSTKFVYTIDVVENARYKMDDGSWQDSNVFDGIAPESSHTFYIKLKENTNYNESTTSVGTQVTFTKLANTTVPALAYTVSGDANTRVITITEVEGAEYSFDGGITWQASNVKTGIDGTNEATKKVSITIRYKETAVCQPSTPAQTVEVDVTKTAQTITFDTTARSATYGDGVLEARTATAEGAVTYFSSDESVATVDANGVVTVLKAGKTTITASAAETPEYAAVSASYTLTVFPKALTITADDKEAYVGSRMPELTYKVSGLIGNDTISVELSCDANMYRAGETPIIVTATDPDGNYEITTVNGTLTVEYFPYIPPIITPTYPPVVDGGDDGDVVVSPKNPEQGDTVIITPDPDAGYEVDKIIVTDKNGNPVTVVDNGDGTYSFKQPSGKVNIEVTFKEIDTECSRDWNCPMYGYSDLDRTAWYHDGIHYCIEHGLMVGIDANIFAPNTSLTRAMLVTILWRLEGSPVVNYAMDFEDVAAEQWYTEAIRWAASEKIVEGYGNGKFGTNDAITREQLATILYRYEQKNGGGFKGTWMFRMDYVDLADVSDWAYEAMCWMNMNSIVNGKPGKVLDPKGSATRAEAAAMLQRYCELNSKDN